MKPEKRKEKKALRETEGYMESINVCLFYSFIPYPSNICSFIMVEPIFQQPFAIGAHKKIKLPCHQQAVYAILPQATSVDRPEMSLESKERFTVDKQGGWGKTLVKIFNMLQKDA